MKNVFVSIIDYNGRDNTNDLLDSLEKLDMKGFNLNVLVIDNASREKYKTSKKFNNFTLEIIRSEKNLGFSGGHNIGMEHAVAQGADYVLVLNNDVILDRNLISELIKGIESKDGVAIVSPKIYFASGFEFHKDRYSKEDLGRVFWYAGGKIDWDNVLASHRGVDEIDNGQYDNMEITDFATGCCMLIKSEVLKKVGFFDEKYFLYYEDNDLSQRVRKSGFKILYVPKAILWHKNADSAGGSGSILQDYYITRNRLLFGIRFAPFRAKTALITESVRLLIRGRNWQKKGVLDFFKRKFKKGSFNE